MRIIFLGTPEFAVPSLAILNENGYDIAAVVTAPDKPAGRGQKIRFSAVKKYALDNGLNILQPTNLKDVTFLSSVKKLDVDLGIVVAFRMMPEELWTMPKLGTFNLHGSLLPQYRGAAPINRAVMNGEKVTGLTTFFLKQAIDTGNIIFREEVNIGSEETAGELHDRMKIVGAQLVLKTVKAIKKNDYHVEEQGSFVKPREELKQAPKIHNNDRLLNFDNNVVALFNQVRGLSPYPSAYFEIKNKNESAPVPVKVIRAGFELSAVNEPKKIITDNKTFLKIAANGGFLAVLELQWPGKRAMPVDEFLRGFALNDDWLVI